MAPPSPAVLSLPAADLPLSTVETAGLALVALGLSGLFALMRSALLHAVPARVLAQAATEEGRERLRPLLERADSLRTTASAYTTACQSVFLILVLAIVFREGFSWTRLGVGLVVTVPLLVFVGEILPQAVRGRRHDTMLVRFLPWFHVLHLPLAAPVHGLEVTRRFTMRVFRIPE